MEYDSFQEKDKNIKFIQDLEETCKADQNDVVETEHKDNSPTQKQIFKQEEESMINKKRKREKKRNLLRKNKKKK